MNFNRHSARFLKTSTRSSSAAAAASAEEDDDDASNQRQENPLEIDDIQLNLFLEEFQKNRHLLLSTPQEFRIELLGLILSSAINVSKRANTNYDDIVWVRCFAKLVVTQLEMDPKLAQGMLPLCGLDPTALFETKLNNDTDSDLNQQFYDVGETSGSLFQQNLSEKQSEALSNTNAVRTLLILISMTDNNVYEDEKFQYDARTRVCLRSVSKALNLDWLQVVAAEDMLSSLLISGLLAKAYATDEKPKTEEEILADKKLAKKKRFSKYLKIGSAGVVAGTLMAVTAGLAAPAIGAGLATIGGAAGIGGAAAIGGFIGSAGGVVVITTLFGGIGGGLTGYKMSRRVASIRDFEFVEFLESSSGNTKIPKLAVTICISGFLNRVNQVVWKSRNKEQADLQSYEWLDVDSSHDELFVLHWQREELVNLGLALQNMAINEIKTYAVSTAIMQTAAASLASAIAWPLTVLKVADIIDNPWGVAYNNAQEAGKELARILAARTAGHRPVNLVGFSLGALVIVTCLLELATKFGMSKANGVVQDVILLGTPALMTTRRMAACRSVVSGTIVNGYCSTDWVLLFLCRSLTGSGKVAGLYPMEYAGIENVDLKQEHFNINGHGDYLSRSHDVVNILLREFH